MPASGLQHLVLLGTGLAHLQVLRSFAEQRPASLNITVVAPSARPLDATRLPDIVTGRCTADEASIDLTSLLQQSGAKLVQGSVAALDAPGCSLTLASGETLRYDGLSLNLAPTTDRARLVQDIPGALQHALNLRPAEGFCQLWPQLAQLAKSRALQVAVVGGGAAGVELALALQQALSGDPGNQPSRVSLVTGGQAPAARYAPAVQRRVAAVLKRHHITVLQDRCTGMDASELRLASGARLACDAPVLALGAHPPAWLPGSGLALGPQGFVATDASLQSSSHDTVFAVGDASAEAGPSATPARPWTAWTVPLALHAGHTLAGNLRARLDNTPPKPWKPPAHPLALLFAGDQRAIAGWRGWSAEGAWAAHIRAGWQQRLANVGKQ